MEAGFAKVVGTDIETVLDAVNNYNFQIPLNFSSPFGEGNASEKIVDIIDKENLI